MKKRTNDEWLADLAAEGPRRTAAVGELRAILFNGLRRGLSGQVDLVGADFDALIDDFIQDALLKVLANVDTFEGRSRFTTWAYKIAIHVALSELRRKRWRDRSLDNMLESEDGEFTPSFIADRSPGPEATTEQAEMFRRVRALLEDSLTDKQRTVVMATAVDGASPAAVAEQLGMKTNAVYKVLHDARTRLRKRLAEQGLDVADVLAVFEG